MIQVQEGPDHGLLEGHVRVHPQKGMSWSSLRPDLHPWESLNPEYFSMRDLLNDIECVLNVRPIIGNGKNSAENSSEDPENLEIPETLEVPEIPEKPETSENSENIIGISKSDDSEPDIELTDPINLEEKEA